MDPSRKDAAAVQPTSFMMPLPTGGYQVGKPPPDASMPQQPAAADAPEQLADGAAGDDAAEQDS